MSCLFCGIVGGSTEAAVVFEDEISIAFLDNRPLFAGHTLLIPREHTATLLDLRPALVGPLFLNAQRIAGALETALGATGSFVAVNNRVSQSVPHLHIHIVPRRPKDGLKGFFWPRHTYSSPEEMIEIQERLKAALS